jgi:tryptophan synthase alpha chain
MFSGKSLIPYITYADPTPEMSEKILCACFEAGAAVVEVGMPFSDPIADGPVIQASHQRALIHRPKMAALFLMVQRVKVKYKKPIVLMGSVNLILHYGILKFFEDASRHGVDGVVIPDLPVEESKSYADAAKKFRVAIIFLVSPLCSPERLKRSVKASSGFVYVISSTGTTGERSELSRPLDRLIADIRRVKNIPVAIGFGIHSKAQVDDVHRIAEGAIVGSAIVRVIGENSERSDLAQLIFDRITYLLYKE